MPSFIMKIIIFKMVNLIRLALICHDIAAAAFEFLHQIIIISNPRHCTAGHPMTLELRGKGDRWHCRACACREEFSDSSPTIRNFYTIFLIPVLRVFKRLKTRWNNLFFILNTLLGPFTLFQLRNEYKIYIFGPKVINLWWKFLKF